MGIDGWVMGAGGLGLYSFFSGLSYGVDYVLFLRLAIFWFHPFSFTTFYLLCQPIQIMNQPVNPCVNIFYLPFIEFTEKFAKLLLHWLWVLCNIVFHKLYIFTDMATAGSTFHNSIPCPTLSTWAPAGRQTRPSIVGQIHRLHNGSWWQSSHFIEIMRQPIA